MLTLAEIEELKKEMELVPEPRAAVIEALKIVQRRRGWVSDDDLESIAAYLKMSTQEVDSVATFYNLIFRKPVGKHVILVCDSVSCGVMGYSRIYQQLQEKLKIKFGETSVDGRFTLLPNACLGCCDRAPALMIDDNLYGNITPKRLDDLIEQYQ